MNQYTVLENHNKKRPDVLLLINGLPLVAMELKKAADENADIHAAYQQLQTYKQLIPSLFIYNAILVVSDSWFARVGALSSEYPRFILDLIRHFIVFEETREKTIKKVAA